MRGTVSAIEVDSVLSRITPACAGNRETVKVWALSAQDHPRVCGEQINIQLERLSGLGSPPRVRGTVPAAIIFFAYRRITPACAGNRLKKARHFNILFCQIKRIHLV